MKRLLILLAMFFLSTSAQAANEWDKTRIDGTTLINDVDTVTQTQHDSLDRILSNYKRSMLISYSSASAISVSAGEITCSNTAGTVRRFRKNSSATSVTFSDLDTGAEASSTTYYVYAICDADAETATFKISAQSASAPSGTTYFRRIGYFYNDSSSNITAIRNDDVVALGDWVSKTVEITYQATTDGFVTAWGGATSANAFINGLSDNSTSPSTRRIYCEPGVSGKYDGIMFPVKAGDYYKVDTDDITNAGMFFIPLQ